VIATELIEGDVHISEGPVDEAKDPWQKIIGLNTEINNTESGKSYFDLLFSSLLSKDSDKAMLIDVEAQNIFNPGYPLLCRAVFYIARLINVQKNTVFQHSSYELIRKVASIWICTDPPDEARGTVTRYSLNEDFLVGKYASKKEDYDKMTIVMINVPGEVNQNEAKADMLGLLNLLLSQKYSAEKINYYLHHKYQFPFTPNLESEVNHMCTYAEGLILRTETKAKREGKLEGKLEGRQEEKLSIAKNLYQMGMPVSNIAQATGLSCDEITKELGLQS
jgi:predicted transposase/invertase (TIGR01784 family)